MKPISPNLDSNNQENTTKDQQLNIPTEALKFIEALKARKSSAIMVKLYEKRLKFKSQP